MTERERMLAVYRGETPDRVPLFLDLSHWFYHKNRLPFDLSDSPRSPEWPLIEYHQRAGVGFYAPNRISYFDLTYPPEVRCSSIKRTTPRGWEITWRIETPLGTIERRRLWQEQSYSWNISEWGVRTAEDLRVLGYALSRMKYHLALERYRESKAALGDLGVLYMPLAYSAMGHLMSYWMGPEELFYAAQDMPQVLDEVVGAINANLIECLDVLCRSEAEVILLGDNFSSDIQPPRFFRRWSENFYREAFRRIRATGKHSAVHVDGRMNGLLGEFARLGADCIDAVTPAPMGDLAPAQCREQAGPALILSGGVAPNLWIESATDEEFCKAVIEWLEIRKLSPRLIAAAGDQVPPFALEHRITMMRELVEEHGRY